MSLAVIWGATAINLRGAFRVGRVSIWAGVVRTARLPRAGATRDSACAARAVDTVHELRRSTVRAGLAVGLSTALWNYIGWDNASTVQGEVIDASRSYPRALLVALPLVTLGYFVPLLPALAASRRNHVAGRVVAGDRRARHRQRRAVHRGVDRARRARERARAVQRAAALVFTHSARDGAGRAASGGARAARTRRGTPRARRARVGRVLFSVRAAAVRKARCGRCAAVRSGASARVRRTARAATEGAAAARRVQDPDGHSRGVTALAALPAIVLGARDLAVDSRRRVSRCRR